FGYGGQLFPGQVGLDRDDVAAGHAGQFGIAAADAAAHAAHERHDLLSGHEPPPRISPHDAGAFDATDLSAISGQLPSRLWTSAWFRPKAFTSMTTCPASGWGSGRSSIARTSGPPYRLITIARMEIPPSLSDGDPGMRRAVLNKLQNMIYLCSILR